jgi:hypothetical protein
MEKDRPTDHSPSNTLAFPTRQPIPDEEDALTRHLRETSPDNHLDHLDNPPDAPESPGIFAGEASTGDEERPEVVKRGRGRPRKDGMPVRSSTMGPMPMPTPPFKRFWSDASNGNQKPQKLLNWIQECPAWARERMTLFISRDWPVLIHITPEMKQKAKREGRAVEHNYIDKISGDKIIKAIHELQDRYGAGDYSMILSDGETNQNLATVSVREGWRDIRAYPPSDNRVDRVENLEMTDKSNGPYIAYLKGQGKLVDKDQERKGEEMAEVSAVKEVVSLAREVMNKSNAQGQDGGKAAEVVAEAAKQGFEIISKSKEIADSQAANKNPLDDLTKIVDVVDKLRPPQQKSDGELLGTILERMADMNKVVLSIQNERIAFAEKVALEAANRGTAATAATAGTVPGAGTVDPFEAGIERFSKIASLMGWKMPGRMAGGEAAEPSTGVKVMEVISDLLPGVNGLFSNILTAWQTKVYADAVAKGVMPGGMMPTPPPPPQPVPVMNPMEIAGTAGAGVEEENGAGDGGDDEMANFTKFMEAIKRPLLNHINRNLGGDRFAEFLIDMYDEATFEQVRGAGSDALAMALNSYPPIAAEIRGKDAVVKKFVEEFVGYDPNVVDEDDGGQG